jgi:hypothetical protein
VFYPTVEHAFQAAKTHNKAKRKEIAKLKSPGEAKRAGKALELREDWEYVKVAIMVELVRAKFEIPVLRRRLLETGDRQLIEGNHWGDTFWGVCKGEGENWLGRILMLIRDEIQQLER